MFPKFLLFPLAILAGVCTAGPVDKPIDVSQFFEVTQPETRIVGGTPAPDGSVPYMVALSTGSLIRSFLCGASLVTDRHVITAAHCFESIFSFGSLSSSLRGTVGTNRWNSGGVTFRFSRNFTHPHYVRQNIKNDITVGVINGRVTFTPLINQVTLDFNPVQTSTVARVHGFGRLNSGGSMSSTLMQLDATIIDNDFCHEEIQRYSQILNIRAPPVEGHIEMCTFHSTGHGTCNGDSGSALVRVSNGAQIGIVSWGFSCALGAPDVFVRLEGYMDWLLGVLV